jgi:hypothetical protein
MSQQAVDVGAERDLEENRPPKNQPHGSDFWRPHWDLPQHAGGKSREYRWAQTRGSLPGMPCQ